MLLHFQTDDQGWESPQVLSGTLRRWLAVRPVQVALTNVTPARQQLLQELSLELPAAQLLEHARKHTGDTTIRDRVLLARLQVEQNNPGNTLNEIQDTNARYEFFSRSGNTSKLGYGKPSEQRISKDVAVLNFSRNGEEWLHTGQVLPNYNSPPQTGAMAAERGWGLRRPQTPRAPLSAEVVVSMSPMVGVWLPTAAGRQRLMALRLVRLEEKTICQGIVLDGERLPELLAEEVQDLFPGARVEPAGEPSTEELAETMTALPFRLDPQEAPAPEEPGWTPLRIGLSLAWAAATVALVAVGLGGWSLLDLSERRIRFVTAVSHELRTPLTTFRLYLDMLLGGMVQSDRQRDEYLHTLEAETDRLTRLVGNVLDYSRLESQHPRPMLATVRVADVLAQVRSAWQCRCHTAGKEFVIEDEAGEATLNTDVGLLGQVLGNLLDNACKYSREAADRHVWLRTRREGGQVIFEVEDRGPGVPPGERRLIFRPFRRGRASDATTGGVGLGLALACRWAGLLGGRLSLRAPATGGACFRVELPAAGGN
jgi:signal transduction histidine kinase